MCRSRRPAERLSELEQRYADIIAGGGPEKVRRQHESGKLTARERLSILFDDGDFEEVDAFVEHRCGDFGMDEEKIPGDAVVTAYGKVGGRTMFAFAQDFTVAGGTLGEMHASKICKIMDMAIRAGCPIVGLNDSGGARIQEGVNALDGFGRIFVRNTMASGYVPQISVILGPCAGGAVYSPGLTDFIFVVSGTSQMFITGPQVTKAATGEDVTYEMLGGADVHSRTSGVAHFCAKDEAECLEMVKKLLSYLPSNSLEEPPKASFSDGVERRDERFRRVLPDDPSEAYDVKEVIRLLVDGGDFLEVHQAFAANAVVGFGRLGGRVIGVVANQPQVWAGCLDINASDKIARFVRFCDCFNIPLVTFVDTPGYLPGVAQESGGIIRHGAKVLYAYSEATVPKLSVILRKSYGGAFIAMCAKSLGADHAFAWPTAEIAVMGPEGAVSIVFRKEIAGSSDPEETARRMAAEYEEKFANPYRAASMGYIDAVIDPADTRRKLFKALEASSPSNLTLRRSVVARALPPKKHGNIPL